MRAQDDEGSGSQGAREEFLASVDADGDGICSDSDRFTVEWWLDEGGSYELLRVSASEVGACFDVSDFLASAAAYLGEGDPPMVGAENEQNEPGGGGAPDSQGSPCDAVTYDTLPTLINRHVPLEGSLQSAVDDGDGVPNGGNPWVVKVGTLTTPAQPLAIFGNFPNGLIIFSENGPATTIVDATGFNVPCLRADGASVVAPFIKIGLATSADPTDWFGFTFRGGRPFTGLAGAGIRLADLTSVEVRGSIIGDATLPNVANDIGFGGGIGIERCDQAVLVANQIAFNLCNPSFATPVGGDGAGIFSDDSSLTMADCTIHDNGFSPSTTPSARRGGGLFWQSALPERRDLLLCGNSFVSNEATQGCGAYVTWFPFMAGTHSVHIEGNAFESNHAYYPFSGGGTHSDYWGGGLAIKATTNDLIADGYTCRVYNNLFDGNDIREFDLDDPPPSTQNGVGGGLYVDVELIHSFGPGVVEIVGNVMRSNQADAHGAGAWMRLVELPAVTPLSPALIGNNTISNNIFPTLVGTGAGVYLVSTAYRWTSGVVFGNDGGTMSTDPDWFAETTGAPAFRFTQMPTASGTSLSLNLYGTGCDNVNPSLDSLAHIGSPLSRAIDSAESPTTYTVPVAEDIDTEPRIIDITNAVVDTEELDRGADEYFSVPFIRGDANGDTSPNVADTVYILNHLFLAGPMLCLDAGDVNDDGSVNLGDPITLNAFLFSGGPPPAAPFPLCGRDSTTDGLPECRDASYLSCP